ncbi:MAG: bile acid:sodium symporter family protein [Proteobacteria bacterium]|nr:bile acid:sodium symporter family protein [Pseudomonadota bacterium]
MNSKSTTGNLPNKTPLKPKISMVLCLFMPILFWMLVGAPFLQLASAAPGEATYNRLSDAANGKTDASVLETLNLESRNLEWSTAPETQFVGNLRLIKNRNTNGSTAGASVYLVRKLTGDLLILSVPENMEKLDLASPYANLDKSFESKNLFKVRTMEGTIAGHSYTFAQLIEKPEQLPMDRLFKICIILMLFFVMVGMGMTLTTEDFALVFLKPRGIIIGLILVFGLMPLLAMVIGHALGFYETYPFIFVGLILITATPGGVTSNLMTYYGKGDLALSISLTSFSTVLSIVFTPLLLALYCANMPEITIPVKVVVQTIMILVIIPLIIGMLFRWKWPLAAKKATPFFSALGIIALLVLIIAGILSNLNIFVDTARYGVAFYGTIFAITMIGMLLGIVFSRLFGVDNYQARAISIETGLRNSALAMTLALLIQDSMGDFFSSMFVTAGIFGLVMYVAGIISIYLYRYILPVAEKTEVR